MSLVKCPECGQDISDKAASCPHCGCKQKTSSKSATATIVILSLVIVALAGAGVWYLFLRGGGDSDERAAYERIVRLQNENQLDSLADALEDYFDIYDSDASHYLQLKDLREKFFTERADWQAAQGIMSVDAIRHFLDVHPDGVYLKQANHLMDSLSFCAASEADTRDAYEQYLAQFPEGAYLKEARELMEDLDNVAITVEEKAAVQEAVSAHFDALATNDRAGVAATLAETINSYLGKNAPEMEDIYAYMRSMHSTSRAIVFLVKNPVVTKMEMTGSVLYNVQFVLDEETYSRAARPARTEGDATAGGDADAEGPKPEDVKHFTGVAVLNENKRIVSLVLRQ